MTKEQLRDRLRPQKRYLQTGWVAERSRLAQDRLMGLAEFEGASCVACYLALPSEVQTDLIMEACWSAGKTVCVPVFRPETKGYAMSVLERGAARVEGRLGIAEPAAPAWVADDQPDFAVVPGVAFDAGGGRLGHGGGYYDRLLVQYGAAARVGLAFEIQVLAHVPTDEKDVPMQMIVTGERIIRVGRAQRDRTD